MPEISIDSKLSALQYGVNAEETFWCKHGVLTISGLKESEDEQFIADIVLSIVTGKPFPASREAFDNYYGSGKEDKSSDIDVKINSYGIDNLRKDILTVFSEIFNFLDFEFEGERLKKVLNPKAGGNPVKQSFYTLYMAFYELVILDNKVPFQFLEIKESVSNLHSKLSKLSHYTTTKDRANNINLCKGLIQNNFKKSDTTFRSSTSYVIDFKSYLMKSKVESAIYDFKQGFYTLSPQGRKFDEKSFTKILCNISALANIGKEKKGFLFIGVTDKESDTSKVEKIDNMKDIPRYYDFGIVGLEREAKLREVTLDE